MSTEELDVGGERIRSNTELPDLARKGLYHRRSSFINKQSRANIGEGGEWRRPNLELTDSRQNVKINEKLYSLMQNYLPRNKETIQKNIVGHVEYTLARTRFDFKALHCYQGVAHSVRDRLIESFNDTHREFSQHRVKKVYYLSLEFLIGRCLQNAIINLDVQKEYKEALMELGFELENVYEQEVDPALGNGGLGRLAACFLDSLATLNYPAWGYGIRYEYGIFRQIIRDGNQVEVPDFWLNKGNPWEIERLDVQYKVRFYGSTRKIIKNGKEISIWENYETIVARAYDTPIPGYATFNTLGLRLWRSLPANEFDFNSFNTGDYFKALEEKQKAEYITSVLYPNDSTTQGKQLRLKQEYLLVSASMQDIIRRHKNQAARNQTTFLWTNFAKEAAIQLNDTHPTLAIVELLRIMIDEQGLEHDVAWQAVYDTFAYTNHTVLPEALEKWGVDILGRLLPRHLEIIYLINHLWLQKVAKKFPGNMQKLSNLSIIEQGHIKKVRMAHLSIVGSHMVNGVAQIHSDLITNTLFKDFFEFFPSKFTNKTNGVTPRRWIVCANPLLAELYTEHLNGDSWILNLKDLRQLEPLVEDKTFRNKWHAIKQESKKKLAIWIKKHCMIDVDVESLFDVQVKRIHEYKRQLLNILYCIHRYLTIKDMTPEKRKEVVPRTVMFGGKAAPGYLNAKRIIKLINEVGTVVNNDPSTRNFLKVIFLPNYNVSNAEVIIPASDISEHISTAGTEASGTSNMKFVMNGGQIIGTLDGANVEIAEEVGRQNMFIFGAKVEEVDRLKERMRNTHPDQYICPELKRVFNAISEGRFGSKEILSELIDTIRYNNDWYLVCEDFPSYLAAQKEVDEIFKNKDEWLKRSILNAIRSDKFSSDRTIREYADEIWHAKPFPVMMTTTKANEMARTNGV